MAAPKSTPGSSGYGAFLKEAASRDPIGRVLTSVLRLGNQARLSAVAAQASLSDEEFLAAVAEAEWGGLLKREKRDDGGVYLVLTTQGLARAEAILRPA